MRVRMLVDIQGFRALANGDKIDWPARGVEAEMEDEVAIELIRSGQAVPVSTFGEVETTTMPDAQESRVAGTSAALFARPVDASPQDRNALAEKMIAENQKVAVVSAEQGADSAALAPAIDDLVKPVDDAAKTTRSRKSTEASQ